MKKCPYCAEEIQDEAILCRYCKSDLSVPPPSTSQAPAGGQEAPAAGSAPTTASPAQASPSAERPPERAEAPQASAAPAAATTAAGTGTPAAATTAGGTGTPAPTVDTGGSVIYTHSGQRYVLGYGADFFGIWDRQAPSTPVERFARTDEGWRQAWTRYASIEPGNVEVSKGQPGAAAVAAPTPGGGTAQQYTHSGQRYLLGYGQDFFGIWDRASLAQPVRRFPRTDEGWRSAWSQFSAWEPHSAEVGLGP